MDQEVRKQKRQLRRQMRKVLSAMGAEERQERSRRLCENVVALPEWQDARCIALFSPMNVEPDLHLLWETGAFAEKTVAYSRIEEGDLEFYAVEDPRELQEEQTLLAAATQPVTIAVPEARGDRRVAVERMDVVLIPGLAFTQQGERLGKGGGFYDRFLSRADFDAVSVGIAYDLQVLEKIPTEAHDCRVNKVVTDLKQSFG
jgi:5-formyltetrahydrofolate cyclo-ligase